MTIRLWNTFTGQCTQVVDTKSQVRGANSRTHGAAEGTCQLVGVMGKGEQVQGGGSQCVHLVATYNVLRMFKGVYTSVTRNEGPNSTAVK